MTAATVTVLFIFFTTQGDLSQQKIQQIFRCARGLNLDLQKNNFVVLAFLKIADIGMAWKSLDDEATHIEVVYINKVPGKVPPGMLTMLC